MDKQLTLSVSQVHNGNGNKSIYNTAEIKLTNNIKALSTGSGTL